MLDYKRTLAYLSSVKDLVSRELRSKIEDIIRECEYLRSLGKLFAFSADPELDAKINSILIEVSDELLDDFTFRTEEVVSDKDTDAVLAFVNKDNPQEKMDMQMSRLKYILEGYIAVGFANKLSGKDIVRDFFVNISNPYGWSLLKTAYSDPVYKADIVRSRGFHFGKGNYNNIAEGISLIGENIINSGYQFSLLEEFKRTNAIGYKVHRGSGYDCAICDEMCVGIHPLDEQVLPVHPHCRCYATAVYKSDVD